MQVEQSIMVGLVLFTFACGGGSAGAYERAPASQRCPPPGTELPPAQIFGEFLPGCDVATTADFDQMSDVVGGCSGNWTLKGVSPSDLCILVTNPGETVATGGQFRKVRVLDPSQRSAMYQLKKGTRLRLRGEPWVSTENMVLLFDAKQVEVLKGEAK